MKGKHNRLVISLLLLNAGQQEALQAMQSQNELEGNLGYNTDVNWFTYDDDRENLQLEEEGSLRLESQKEIQLTPEFIKSRNALNQDEAVHSDMYDTLIDKLTDSSFISHTIHQKEQKPQHLGQIGASDVKNAQKGSSTLCASEGQTCECSGTVIYSAPRGDKSVVPEVLKAEAHVRKEDVDGTIECTNAAFGEDPAKGKKKQCVCVKDFLAEMPSVTKCASDGGDCKCASNVFYGPAKDGKFESIFKQKDTTYGLKPAAGGSIKCSADLFGDPAPKSKDKACFCQKVASFKPEKDMLVEKCADENQKCTCLGTVHFGVSDGKGGFSSAFVSKDLAKTAPQKGSVTCSNSEFGDPAIGKKKQCLCERPKPPSPLPKNVKKCGEEGELCKCNGQVYMGRLHGDDLKKGVTVEEILDADKKRKDKEDKKAARKKAHEEKKDAKDKKEKKEADKAPKKSSKKEESKTTEKKKDKEEYVPKPGEGYDKAGADPQRPVPKGLKAGKSGEKFDMPDLEKMKSEEEKEVKAEQEEEEAEEKEAEEQDTKDKSKKDDSKHPADQRKDAKDKTKKNESDSDSESESSDDDEKADKKGKKESESDDEHPADKRKAASDKSSKESDKPAKKKEGTVKKADKPEKKTAKKQSKQEKKEAKATEKLEEKDEKAQKKEEKEKKAAIEEKNAKPAEKQDTKKTATKDNKKAKGLAQESKEKEASPTDDEEVEEDESDEEEVDDEEDLMLGDDEDEDADDEEFSRKEIGFDDMMKYGFASKEAFGTVKCSTEEFGDPAFGHSKQCFCESETPEPEVERCALESDKTDCVCVGKVYYGQVEVGEESLASFELMKAQKKFKVVDSKGSIGCNNEDIGGDPAPGLKKQCFCEKGAAPQVKRCGLDDDDCQCTGNVFYGALEKTKNKRLSFKEMLEQDFQYTTSEGKKPVKCAPSSFEKDPLPGKAKQCYCDDIEDMSKEEIKNAQDLLEAKAEAQKAEEDAKRLEEEKDKESKEEDKKIALLEKKKKEVETLLSKDQAEAKKLADAKQKKYNAEALEERKKEEKEQLKLDSEAHQKELAAQKAEQDAKMAKQKAESAAKAAKMAKQADKLKLQLQAQKLKAEQEKKEQAEKEAETAKKMAEHRAQIHKQQAKAAAEAEKANDAVEDALKAQELKAKEAAVLAKLEVERKIVEDEKIRAETEAARKEAAIEAAIEKALAEQTRIYKLKAEEEAKQLQIKAEKQRIKEEEEKRLAAMEAERQAKIEAQKRKVLEEKRKALEEEERKRKAEEKAQKAAEEAIRKQQEEIARKAQEERDAVLKAQREEALAKTAAEVQAAKEKTAGLEAKLKDILKEKEGIEDQKRELAIAKEREIAAGKQAKADAKQAEKDLAKARELAKKKKQQAQQLKKKLEDDKAAAAAKLKELIAAAEKKLKENQAREAEAKAARERLHKMELEKMQKEREARMAARKEKDAAMAAAHRAKMLARKEAFEATFRNVWGASPQGVAQVQVTLQDGKQAEDLKRMLFVETAIADVHHNNETLSRTFKSASLLHEPFKGLLHVDKPIQRLHMVTTDDRVAEVIEMTYKVTRNPKTPLLVTTLHGASKQYIKWVQKQCEPNDDEGHFSNTDPFDNSKPIAEEAVSKMVDHEKQEKKDAGKSNHELEQEAVKAKEVAKEAKKEAKKEDTESAKKEAQEGLDMLAQKKKEEDLEAEEPAEEQDENQADDQEQVPAALPEKQDPEPLPEPQQEQQQEPQGAQSAQDEQEMAIIKKTGAGSLAELLNRELEEATQGGIEDLGRLDQ